MKEKKELKILFIDDDAVERLRFSQTLMLLDVNVDLVMAENGWDAIHQLINLQDLPDIIVHDIHMPEMNGIEFLRKIKDVNKLKHIPKIAFTSSSNSMELKSCQELGVNSILIKPIKPETYIETINLLIQYWSLNSSRP
ncbi:response regulator [Algoriphagus pacificus]|uniref:Response regulator n=1 Tax=Algoriphagus pacificus TaxID=2811234 RepID=A0ABS3CIK0_9BACT|nr:response regulator [Algoriphagus pacificus]MBN7816329.1 response regulator [Algoriphagus pacificus]